jgi:hemerythrin-like domain-containing protein
MANPIEPVDFWHTEHVYFGHLLDLAQKELDVLHAGERPNYELLQDVVSYLRDYGDHVHHRREDVAFERLARRCPDLKLELARLRQEHRVLATAGEALLALVESVLEGSILPRQEFEKALLLYLACFRGHMRTEEDVILPRAGGALTDEDWDAVRAIVPSADEPAVGVERYRELRRLIVLET